MNSPTNAAFPASLSATVSRLTSLLLPATALEPSEPFCVSCESEILLIPYRIYYPAPSDSAFRVLNLSEQPIVACWFTRHHDGHVRERFLCALRVFDCAWIIAYVVALCGEYVIELFRYVWERRDLFDRQALGYWLRENGPFYALARSTIVSYWDCYYRSACPRFGDYVGSHILAFFDDCIIGTDATGNA